MRVVTSPFAKETPSVLKTNQLRPLHLDWDHLPSIYPADTQYFLVFKSLSPFLVWLTPAKQVNMQGRSLIFTPTFLSYFWNK